MNTGRIDVHSHLLPTIDDGCPDYENSFACAQVLVDHGYTHAFCTPHVWPQLAGNTVDAIRQWTFDLQVRLDEARIPLSVLPGGEINLLWAWPRLRELPREQVVTYGMDGRYVLFDFWADESGVCTTCLAPAVRHLQSLGLTPILAHPERVIAFHRDPAAIDRLTDMGVLLQMNTWTLTDPPGTPTYELAARLLRDHRYFLLGTDAHHFDSMAPRMRGLEIAAELVGIDEVERLTVHNPRKLATEETWDVTEPEELAADERR